MNKFTKLLCWLGIHKVQVVRSARDSLCGNEITKCDHCCLYFDIYGNEFDHDPSEVGCE